MEILKIVKDPPVSRKDKYKEVYDALVGLKVGEALPIRGNKDELQQLRSAVGQTLYRTGMNNENRQFTMGTVHGVLYFTRIK